MIERWRDQYAPIRCVTLLAPALLASSCLGCSADPSPGDAYLSVSIVDDATGAPTPARVRFTDASGDAGVDSDDAIRVTYGREDPPNQRGWKRQPNGAFYGYGEFGVQLAPGTYRLSLSKGYEYLGQEHELIVEAGENLSRTFRLERWIDMPARGWFSADDHIHIRRSPRENPRILAWMAAEDVHVGALLQMGDSEEVEFTQYAWGQDGVYQLEDYLLTAGQEDPRTHDLGHTISLGAADLVRFADDYYSYDRVFDRVHELGGVTGYAHQGVGFYSYRGMTLDVLRNKVDFLELLQFCEKGDPLRTEHYYHFLDLGFRLTATAGSDFPWCGRGGNPQIGDARFYTYIGGELTFDSWRESLRAGHTFVSSGPVVELTIDDAIPGDTLNAREGSTLTVRAAAYGHAQQTPLENLEVVAHGEVIGSATASDPGQSREQLTLAIELPVWHGLWIAARTRAGPTQVAHTTPIYVSVDDSGFHNPATAAHRLDSSDRILDEIEQEIVLLEGNQYREGLEARIAETREVIANLRRELVANP